jgi:hypothetical protein
MAWEANKVNAAAFINRFPSLAHNQLPMPACLKKKKKGVGVTHPQRLGAASQYANINQVAETVTNFFLLFKRTYFLFPSISKNV